ncbi:tRNA (5-methylaminomethyl-2-thiouridine)(34)-methyltransferase MnmD [Calothrix sp. 336/3]|uniref:tRNA (5-methylaminomethyl-2-thiouridine)(34)-methyltransferase MnmD n=1 Tax=Calothrix sp. 336/3 TaxID=1337936 RepID=UPI0004E3A807|nr:MnmC family methyltransferase [Calothrix sp. 336/3]AKG21873.1 hypothetical protein IJ00_11920 [Calothrix sp. 336/3]
MSNLDDFTPQLTADGSFTFFSPDFQEAFHSHHGAKQESFLKFVEPTQLKKQAEKPHLKLLDICYGLGYNTAAALQRIWQTNPDCCVEIIALELNPHVPQSAIKHQLFVDWNYPYLDILTELAFSYQVKAANIKAELLVGDARNTLRQVQQSGFVADAIFLDPFSPPQCPHLWTLEFLKMVAQCLHLEGYLATYSCAAAVRQALLDANLDIGSTPPVGRRSPGTVAAHHPLSHLYPLSLEETEHLLTRAAIPYRDPELQDTANTIIQRRQQEQTNSSLETTSQWRKRWQQNKRVD